MVSLLLYYFLHSFEATDFGLALGAGVIDVQESIDEKRDPAEETVSQEDCTEKGEWTDTSFHVCLHVLFAIRTRCDHG